MLDPREKKLAKLLVSYSVKIQKGEIVLVKGEILAAPILAEIYKEVLLAGGHPILEIVSDDVKENLYKYGSKEQLGWISPHKKWEAKNLDAMIYVRAEENTRSLSNVDPDKQRMVAVAATEINEIFYGRAATGDIKWVLTRIPTQAYAQDADMSQKDYADFVHSTTFCDLDDPTAEWNRIHDEQQVIVDWLKGKKQVTIKSPNANISLSIENRGFINSDGKHNMPSGEIFTSPVEDSAEGWVNFTYPAIRNGREVEGVRLEFKKGKVVKATADKNEEYLLSQLSSDEGARYLGEFAIGTNYGIKQFTNSILFDEKIGGSFHMAVGFGFPDVGSKNKSAIHWDFICDIRENSEIRVDGDLLYKNGQFQI
jgi:aminopeptidase